LGLLEAVPLDDRRERRLIQEIDQRQRRALDQQRPLLFDRIEVFCAGRFDPVPRDVDRVADQLLFALRETAFGLFAADLTAVESFADLSLGLSQRPGSG